MRRGRRRRFASLRYAAAAGRRRIPTADVHTDARDVGDAFADPCSNNHTHHRAYSLADADGGCNFRGGADYGERAA